MFQYTSGFFQHGVYVVFYELPDHHVFINTCMFATAGFVYGWAISSFVYGWASSVSSMDGLSPVSYQNALDPTTTNDNGCQVCSDDFKRVMRLVATTSMHS